MNEYTNNNSGGESIRPVKLNDAFKFLILLFIGKFLKSFGIYLCYDLLKQIHLVQLLFFALLAASFVYVLLQRPFAANKKANKLQFIRLLKYSLFQTFIKLLWLFGLTQCGPLRSTLIFEQSEFVVLCALKAIFLSQTYPARSRGVIVLLIATLILLAFDADHTAPQILSDHPEGRHHGIISHIFYFFISLFDVSDHKGGVLLLVSALFMQIAFNNSSLSRLLLTDIGGAKRLKALSTIVSTVLLAPWAIFNLFSSVSSTLRLRLTFYFYSADDSLFIFS
jgi:zinc transporter 5/7